MRRVTIKSPLFPSDVELLRHESLLCQLQSCRGGELSVVTPAVSDNLFVFGQKRCELSKIFHRGALRARDVAAGEGVSAAGVKQDEVEFSTFNGVQYIIPLFFGMELVGEMIAIGANFVRGESHVCLLASIFALGGSPPG
jgi:hypothetical protein